MNGSPRAALHCRIRTTLLILSLVACGRDGGASQVVAKTGCQLAPHPFARPMPKRLVAIGDLHGDLDAARAVLRLAGAIDDRDHWIGGDLAIVQTGDVLDRGDGEQAILDLFAQLQSESANAGGSFTMLLGNHELMNAAGDFRYVTPGGWKEFGGARQAALAPGGDYALRLAGDDVALQIGDTVFSHAGFLPASAKDPGAINQSARCWLDGEGPVPTVETDPDGPVWTRVWGGDPADCALLHQTLDELGAKRMVVAHTPQDHGITSACDGALWRIDVGLASLYGGPIEALELTVDGARVLGPSSR